MTYMVYFLSETGEQLTGELIFYDVHGIALGSAGIHAGGSGIPDTDIPSGTVLYHAAVPGYKQLTTGELFERSTFTLAKEVPVVKYAILGGVAVGAMVLLARFIKF